MLQAGDSSEPVGVQIVAHFEVANQWQVMKESEIGWRIITIPHKHDFWKPANELHISITWRERRDPPRSVRLPKHIFPVNEFLGFVCCHGVHLCLPGERAALRRRPP